MSKTPLLLAALAATFWLPGSAGAPADALTGPIRLERAIFAGGCFWSTERDLEAIPGVLSAVSGFTGGHVANPTYRQTITSETGHVEAVLVEYNAARISYAQLVRRFLRTIDPTDGDGQFCDRGPNYRTAIFPIGAGQRREAEAAIAEANRQLGSRVLTPVRAASRFYGAEAEHQNYAARNPARYAAYRRGCGKDARLRQVWGG